ncbi:hypothetical protein [Flagellimonas sp. SN16]|jgi:hypothetical protein|uniref:hypothetical protein n=1 Tax=Flagellimonas sp. SN16 TaxID=3415142 RepID=UPI000E220DC5
MEEFEPYLELINTIAVAILGLAFFVQNKIVSSMKDFMGIFDTKKVRDFIEMREETVMTKAENLISNDERIREIMTEVTEQKVDEISEHYKEVMGREHIELFLATTYLLQNCLKDKKDEQLRFLDEFLPNNKSKIIPHLFPEDEDGSGS